MTKFDRLLGGPLIFLWGRGGPQLVRARGRTGGPCGARAFPVEFESGCSCRRTLRLRRGQ